MSESSPPPQHSDRVIQTRRSSDAFKAMVAERASFELDQAEAAAARGRETLISTAAVALMLGTTTRQLLRQRTGEVSAGPPCWGEKSNPREHVKYRYNCVKQWLAERYSKTTILQPQPTPRVDQFLTFATLPDVVEREEDWVIRGGKIIGHALLVDDDELRSAIDDDRLLGATLVEALIDWEWSLASSREPFDAALQRMLRAGWEASAATQERMRLAEAISDVPPGKRRRH